MRKKYELEWKYFTDHNIRYWSDTQIAEKIQCTKCNNWKIVFQSNGVALHNRRISIYFKWYLIHGKICKSKNAWKLIFVEVFSIVVKNSMSKIPRKNNIRTTIPIDHKKTRRFPSERIIHTSNTFAPNPKYPI